jgi:hypothetical protein
MPHFDNEITELVRGRTMSWMSGPMRLPIENSTAVPLGSDDEPEPEEDDSEE